MFMHKTETVPTHDPFGVCGFLHGVGRNAKNRGTSTSAVMEHGIRPQMNLVLTGLYTKKSVHKRSV